MLPRTSSGWSWTLRGSKEIVMRVMRASHVATCSPCVLDEPLIKSLDVWGGWILFVQILRMPTNAYGIYIYSVSYTHLTLPTKLEV